MPARKKTSKTDAAPEHTLIEKIGGRAIHLSHEIAAGTEHLLEAAAEKFSAVKESIINKIGKRVPVKETAKPVAKKKSAKKVVKKAAVKVKKAAVAVKKKAAKKVKAVKKVVKKKAKR
jgi:CMP-2-keto-3-deoxyoctulosonic acid synthetase